MAKFDKVQTMDADYAEKVRDEVIGMFGEEYFYTADLQFSPALILKFKKQLQMHYVLGLKNTI